jgi:membrane protein required for colicin V production
LDVSLGIVIFILVVFVILMINKSIRKAVKFIGLGRLDSIFGLFFGFIRSYVICVCLFSALDIVYSYNKWPININKSYAFPYIEKGSNYLVKVFPNEKKYQDSKEKIEDL